MGRTLYFNKVIGNKRKRGIGEHGDEIASVDLGAGDAWPSYLRGYMIAAHRKVQAGTSRYREKMLEVIELCCPPNRVLVDIRPYYFQSFELDRVRRKEDNYERIQLDRDILMQSGDAKVWLAVAGLEPIYQLICYTATGGFTGECIKNAAKMFEALVPFLPMKQDDLKDTPYSEDELADDRYIEVAEAFKKASRCKGAVGRVF
jgi:hypothetical protein